MRTKAIAIFFIGVLIQFFSAQVNAQYSFERQYNIPSYGGTGIVELDNGFCVIGAQQDTSNNTQLVLFRIDQKGSIVWSRKFWSDTSIHLYPISMNLTDDSSYLISGGAEELKSNGWCCQYQVFCMKADKSGNLIWAKKIGIDSLNEFPNRSVVVDDGGLIMVAARRDTSDNLYSCVFKLDQNGNLQWCTNLDAGEYFDLISPVLTSSGDIFCQGQYLDYYYGYYDPHLANLVCKIDANGILLWSKSYSFDVTFQSWSIVPTLCGYFIVGNTDSTCCPHGNPLVMKIDEDGNFLWAKEYASWFSGQALAAHETCDGGAVFTTWVQTGLSTSAGLTKIDFSGTAQWTHLYGNNEYGNGFNMLQTTDNGYTAFGALNQTGVPLRLYKANNIGEIPCTDTLVYPISFNKTCTVSDVGVVSTGIPIKNLFLHVSDFDLTDSLICLDSFQVTTLDTVYCVATQINSGEELSFLISPNPTTSTLQLHYTLTQPGELMMFDALGRKVKSSTLTSNQSTFKLSVAELPAGVYLVAVESKGKWWREKLVKE
ncbi:MAG TPA: T9SS type A sorting domain-containing protein [Chitinophagales bacterium]|nr:T9SS type A sorting domain-containing protein [Chitinophagales bacterium]